MDTNVLRWFQLVADGATVTEVSELEWTSQPGISRALARLSDEVGAPLLRREGRVLRLTHAGAMFKHHVDAMLHQPDAGPARAAGAPRAARAGPGTSGPPTAASPGRRRASS